MEMIKIQNYLKNLATLQIESKMIDLRNYNHVYEEVTDYLLEIEEVIKADGDDGIENILSRVQEMVEEYNIVPIIKIVGGSVICLGNQKENENHIYYYNNDFGIFKLDESIDVFISKLEQNIDYDSLTDEEWEQVDNGTYKFK